MSAWGGKRDKAGRPSTGINKTVVVRIDAALLPVVNQIKAQYKETGKIHELNSVAGNQETPKTPDSGKAKIDINCKFCSKSFAPKRNTAKFCSDKCRKDNHVAMKKKLNISNIS